MSRQRLLQKRSCLRRWRSSLLHLAGSRVSSLAREIAGGRIGGVEALTQLPVDLRCAAYSPAKKRNLPVDENRAPFTPPRVSMDVWNQGGLSALR
jgi:hypothetical protein